MKLKTIEKALCLALILSALISFTGFSAQCEQVPNQVLRLHILANSDSPEDQTLKLQVRDKIISETAGVFANCVTREQAKAAATANLEKIKAAAQEEIRARGYDYPVEVEISNQYFTTRVYDETTLPAGWYDALRVRIGKAEGHNWWCVIFPALCLPSAQQKQALSQVLSPEQVELLENGNGYQVSFKVYELYEQLKGWLSQK